MIINRNYQRIHVVPPAVRPLFFFSLFLHLGRRASRCRFRLVGGKIADRWSTDTRRDRGRSNGRDAGKSFCDLVERMTLPLNLLLPYGPNSIEFTHLSYRGFRFTRPIYRKINKKKIARVGRALTEVRLDKQRHENNGTSNGSRKRSRR